MNEMRKYLKIMEDISNDLTEEELNSDDLMMMGNYIKNKIVPEIQKNAEVIDMHTELLKEQAGFIQELVEAVNELKGGGSNRTLN